MTNTHTIKKLLGQFMLGAAVLIGATLASAEEQPLDANLTLEVKQFTVEGDNPLSDQETSLLLAPYLGMHSSLDSLEAVPVALEAAMRKNGDVFHRVVIPAQRPENGNIRLQVVRYTLSEVEVTGNKFFSSDNILRSLPSLEKGKSPDVSDIAGEMTTANQHPSKRVTLVIKESLQPQALDAEVKVRDVPVRQTFVSLIGHTRDENNEINDGTGYTRLTVGHQESNLFDRDHVLTMTYTTSPDHVDDVKQFGLFYRMPLYRLQSSLSAYATYSDIDIGAIGLGSQSFNVSGSGRFYGIRFDHAFRKVNQLSHGISLALDDRHFKSELEFGGSSLPSSEVSSRPLSVRYFGNIEKNWGHVSAYVEPVINLSSGRAGDEDEYQAARDQADPDWKALRYGIDARYAFDSGWALAGKFQGQYANEPLIPGEQFGLGGDGSVRGLRDREISGDRGYFVSIEAQAPAWKWGLMPVAFVDHGARKNVETVVGVPNYENAASLGLGLRWKTESKFQASADFAHVISGLNDGTPAGHNKLHFSLFYRF